MKAIKFKWSNRNKSGNGRWGVFYYSQGTGFDTGRAIYYGKNEWNSEDAAIASQEQWEARFESPNTQNA